MAETTHTPLSKKERIDRIRLARTENVGPVTFRQLLARFGSAGDAIDALPGLATRGGRRRPLSVPAAASVVKEFEAADRCGGRLIVLGDADYPSPLAATDDAPVSLCLVGDAALLQRDALAVVGARNASTNGRGLARRLAAEIAAAGFPIVSGMARGIDAAAHEGALDSGTIAVLAGGVDIIYPRENAALYDAIREHGLLVSEMPCGTRPQARHFPRRNRIISGLSLGVLVVEAALRSGSLITARLAGEQGRDVFAIPGSPLDPRCRGVNDLIRNGATLTECADDVLAELAPARDRRVRQAVRPAGSAAPPLAARASTTDGATTGKLHGRITEMLGPAPQPVDALIRDTGHPAAAVWAAILDLELAGRLERQSGNRVALIFE
jgi:DNA processing protein